MKPSPHIIKMENKLHDALEEYFPKGEHKDRGKALVLIVLAKELGVQGHSDNLKQKQKMKDHSESCECDECELNYQSDMVALRDNGE